MGYIWVGPDHTELLPFLGHWQATLLSLFLFYGRGCPHNSAFLRRGEAKGNWGALGVLWHQAAELRREWISKRVLPRQDGHSKWSCGLQWHSTRRLPTEGWPSKMLVYLYISALAKCMCCAVFPGRVGEERGQTMWWKIYPAKYTCWGCTSETWTRNSREKISQRMPRGFCFLLRNQSLTVLSWCREFW